MTARKERARSHLEGKVRSGRIGRPARLKIRSVLLTVPLVFFLFTIALLAFALLTPMNEQRLAEVLERRHRAVELAFELKQSSEDLTHFARAYAATGEPSYEEAFFAILAIRDGHRPHPSSFLGSYVSYVSDGVVVADQGGAATPSRMPSRPWTSPRPSAR